MTSYNSFSVNNTIKVVFSTVVAVVITVGTRHGKVVHNTINNYLIIYLSNYNYP